MKEIQGRAKQTRHAIEIPNLVEQQLNSYRWFLEEGLQELFESFSPIYDFTGNTSHLSDRFYTRRAQILRRRVPRSRYDLRVADQGEGAAPAGEQGRDRERGLSRRPAADDRKGTFIINGAERVVVSQLARSPGVYFKDNLDFSGKVLYYATIIPQEGAWVDVETDNSNVVTVRIGQTRKFPLTTLLRALSAFKPALIPLEMTMSEVLERSGSTSTSRSSRTS